MARYDLTEQAVSDLREIARYTKREWGTDQARRYREELALSLEKLSLSPTIGRKREEIAPGVRSFKVAAHIAFYVERRGGITVLRLLHPHRDTDLAFQKELSQKHDQKTNALREALIAGEKSGDVDELAMDKVKAKAKTKAKKPRSTSSMKPKSKR